MSSLKKKAEVKECISFHDAADVWYQAACLRVKHSSAVKYDHILQCYLLPVLGDIPVSEIDYEIMQNYHEEMYRHGGKKHAGLSPKTIADSLTVCRSILHFAECRGITIQRDTFFLHAKVQTPSMRVFSKTEHQLITNYLCQDPTRKNLGILLCLYTGLRIGEICALHWDDISLSEQTIHVRRTVQRLQSQQSYPNKTCLILSLPKSAASIRTIPLPESVASFLAEKQLKEEGYFLTGDSEHMMDPRTMQYHFKSILRKLNIDHAKFHCLRHTFATRCVELGFDIKTLSVILGHSSVTITMNRYVHPTMEMKQKSMHRLSDFLDEIVEKPE